MGLVRIAGLEEEVRQAQADIAGLRQKVLAARAERDQARAEARILLNKLLLTVNEPTQPAHRTPGPPVWADPDRPRTREVQGGAPAAQ